METIYSRTDGWPSFACWQVACCQHFRLLSYREQQFRILIGTQKDILYSFFWAFTGAGRDTKEIGRGEERKLMPTCDSNAEAVSLCALIPAHNSPDENTKMERLKEVKRVLLPCTRYCQGVQILTPMFLVVATPNNSLKHAERTLWAAMQSTWKKFVETWRFLIEVFFFHRDSDVHYIEQEAAEITFSEAAKLWSLTKDLP